MSLSHQTESAHGSQRGFEKGGSPSMTLIDFYHRLENLQKTTSDATVRLQSFLGGYTTTNLDSSQFQDFKMKLDPYVFHIKTGLETIPTSQSTGSNKIFWEIGNGAKIYKLSTGSFEKAVSRYSIKDAAVALAECDMFIPNFEKLESTVGRRSNNNGSGKQLKPLDPGKLMALYSLLADKSKMSNIQRTEECEKENPDLLTLKEQKMVREALSQYFNQLRQREKRKRNRE